MTEEQFLDIAWQQRATAILRTDDHQIADGAVSAAVEGGFRLVEFTLHCPQPFALIEKFAQDDDLVVGAGTVMTAEETRQAVGAGAKFIVSPIFDEDVVETALELGAIAMPGTRTPTEMVRAYRAGAAVQKLFPAPASGPAFVQATLGPLPFLRLVPTSGVTPENVAQWISAGVFGVGFVGPLFPKDVLADRDYIAVERLAREALAATKAVRRADQRPY